MSISIKLQKLKGLLSRGQYGEIIRRTMANILPYKADFYMHYYRLRRKFRSFLADYDYVNYAKGGGHKNIIWWLWYQGVDNAPDVCKACLASLRRWHPDKEIITLDKNNLSQYVTFPEHITRKHEQGIIDNTKYSNLVRLHLLIEHGGTWIDSTAFCTGRNDEYIMHLPLFAFRLWPFAETPSSWFMVSDPNNPILALIRDLHFEYWRRYDYLEHYFIFHMFFMMAAEKYPEEWRKVPFIYDNVNHDMQRAMYGDYSDEKMQHLSQACDIHKLTWKLSNGIPSPSSIYQHVIDSCGQ